MNADLNAHIAILVITKVITKDEAPLLFDKLKGSVIPSWQNIIKDMEDILGRSL